MCIIGATSPLEWLLVILQVGLGLGAVIFVHELGHFAVAKMCGVKCDKFFIGFDVGGYKLSRQWGETEYGIGILPLGGYVKMLGQDDNPANIAEQVRESEVRGESPIATKEILGPHGETYVVDRRSYLAKSVPQRMAIISAGVIMNVIFAFLFAMIAYGKGVPFIPSIVSRVAPGSAAYEADMRPGDEILQIGETQNPSFSQLMQSVTLGDLENGIPFLVRRAATGTEESIQLKPQMRSGKLARIGVASPSTLQLNPAKPTMDGSAAASAAFAGGDELIAVNGQPIEAFHQWLALAAENVDQPLEVTVRRGGTPPPNDRFGRLEGGETLTLTVPPQQRRRLGLVMEMGKIVSVQANSPAAAKGLKPGDFLDKVRPADDRPADPSIPAAQWDDPMALPAQLNALGRENRSIHISVRRSASSGDGRQALEELELPLRKVSWEEPATSEDDPLSVPALGIAYRVLNRVSRVVPGSPAALAGLEPNDVITQAELHYLESLDWDPSTIAFGQEGNQNWPLLMESLQGVPEGTEVKLTYERDGKAQTVTLVPELTAGQFDVSRGFLFTQAKQTRIASSLSEQIELGYGKTKESLLMVFSFLKKLGTQVPFSALGGPLTIAQAAGYSAFEGVGKLLLFLTMLSANLAVINFLPIPLLDGGHMVFLAWEGIRGRPASERVVVALHMVGFACILSLMGFVLWLDLGRLLGIG